MEQVDISHRRWGDLAPSVETKLRTAVLPPSRLGRGGLFYSKTNALTWSPADSSFLSAAEADFAENPQKMPLAQRAGVFAGTRAAFRGGNPVAVGLPCLALLSDQGAGDRGHLPTGEPRC